MCFYSLIICFSPNIYSYQLCRFWQLRVQITLKPATRLVTVRVRLTLRYVVADLIPFKLLSILHKFTWVDAKAKISAVCRTGLYGHWSAVGRGAGRQPSHVSLFIRTEAIPHLVPSGMQMRRSNSPHHLLISLCTSVSTEYLTFACIFFLPFP